MSIIESLPNLVELTRFHVFLDDETNATYLDKVFRKGNSLQKIMIENGKHLIPEALFQKNPIL